MAFGACRAMLRACVGLHGAGYRMALSRNSFRYRFSVGESRRRDGQLMFSVFTSALEEDKALEIGEQTVHYIKRNDSMEPLYVTVTDRTAEVNRFSVDDHVLIIQQICRIKMREKNPHLMLRVTVESGGCHGYQYFLNLTEKMDPEEDCVFEKKGSKVVIDEISLKIISGSKVDYTTELIGSQFKLVDNPAATSNCGCGMSFDLK